MFTAPSLCLVGRVVDESIIKANLWFCKVSFIIFGSVAKKIRLS
jgi:hypothetical protein